MLRSQRTCLSACYQTTTENNATKMWEVKDNSQSPLWRPQRPRQVGKGGIKGNLEILASSRPAAFLWLEQQPFPLLSIKDPASFPPSSSSSCVSIVTWQSSERRFQIAPPPAPSRNPCQCCCRLRTVYYLVISLPLCRHPTPLRKRGKRSDQKEIGQMGNDPEGFDF